MNNSIQIPNLRQLDTEQYLKESNYFVKQYGKFLEEEAKIIKQEDEIYNQSSAEEQEQWIKGKGAHFEELYKQLSEKFGCYSSLYSSDFYCLLTLENIDALIGKNTANYKYFKRDIKKFIGKKVETPIKSYGYYGICVGIAVMVDDIYFLIKQIDTKQIKMVSAVIGLSCT